MNRLYSSRLENEVISWLCVSIWMILFLLGMMKLCSLSLRNPWCLNLIWLILEKWDTFLALRWCKDQMASLLVIRNTHRRCWKCSAWASAIRFITLWFLDSSLRKMEMEWGLTILSIRRLWEVLCIWLPLDWMLCLWRVSLVDLWFALPNFICNQQRGY